MTKLRPFLLSRIDDFYDLSWSLGSISRLIIKIFINFQKQEKALSVLFSQISTKDLF
jgi:hypothetical protein